MAPAAPMVTVRWVGACAGERVAAWDRATARLAAEVFCAANAACNVSASRSIATSALATFWNAVFTVLPAEETQEEPT